MQIHWKTREFFAAISSMPRRTRTARRRVRDKIRFHDLIESVSQYDVPLEKYPHRINVAFCFDGRGHKLAAVAIKSLMMASQNRCDYDIYCIVDETVRATHKKSITVQTHGTNSRVIFLRANHDFDNSYRAGWPVAVYYRTMLPKLLPNVDKIIYADIDVIFCRDLVEISCIDMGTNLLAGVRDYKNGYINSGFLVMNLKQMRMDNIYEKWIAVSQKKRYANPDQDLLNYTARRRITFLPLRYNFQPMLGSWIFKAHSNREIYDIRYNLVVMHYSNWMKPWHEESKRPIFSEIWWRVARETKLF